MTLEWKKLRPFNGDVKKAFEELICQLASVESIPSSTRFTRIEAPDAGVESYHVLQNGDEYGWQAKFFNELGKSQWDDIESSFKTAFVKHPKLVRYYVCTPLDRQDARIKGKEWSMDRWTKRVEVWKAFAEARGRSMEFEYWGNHEIHMRLTKEANRGRYAFWFNSEEFSDRWFESRLNESVKNLGPRYTPELNVNLPISGNFEGLAIDENFKRDCWKHTDTFLQKCNSNLSKDCCAVKTELYVECIREGHLLVEQIRTAFTAVSYQPSSTECWELLRDHVEGLDALSRRCIDHLFELDRLESEPERRKQRDSVYDNEARKWSDISNDVSYYKNFIWSSKVELSQHPLLVIKGEAGIGKSHLLADVATNRRQKGLPTILLLGQHFGEGDPWKQILNRLHTQLGRDEFLGAMDALGQAAGSRVLVMIDALNEGKGKSLWPDNLPGLLTMFAQYPHIGVVLTVRSSYYEKLITPEIIKSFSPVLVNHIGFHKLEYKAIKNFFALYKIHQPSIPLLHPEFSNPLFLKLFCQGLHSKGLRTIPDGYEGITRILEFFLDGINNTISDKHGVPQRRHVVRKVIKNFAAELAKKDNLMKFDEAYEFIVDQPEIKELASRGEFFQDLMSEGILVQNLVWQDGKDKETISLAYERFLDHLVCDYYLTSYPLETAVSEMFANSRVYFPNMLLCETLMYNRGLLEALCVQLPERKSLEVFDVITDPNCEEEIFEVVIDSMPWRSKSTFDEKFWKRIEGYIDAYSYRKEFFFHKILLISSVPDHFFNSDFIHRYLSPQGMAVRDGWWNAVICHKFHHEQPHEIRRLIDWALEYGDDESLSLESVMLASQAMVWFLTASDRGLRDTATKALVNLLEKRMSLLLRLLKRFVGIDEPYVFQRLYAVACGCALRSSSALDVDELVAYLLNTFPEQDRKHPDYLSRDYVQTIIDKGNALGTDGVKRTLKLSKSAPPSCRQGIETLKTIFPSVGFGYAVSSVTLMGDFGRYILGYAVGHWTGVPLGEERRTRGELFDDFISKLDQEQLRLWHDTNPINTVPIEGIKEFDDSIIPGLQVRLSAGRKTEEELQEAHAKFEASLTGSVRTNYLVEFKPFLDHRHMLIDDIATFDLRIAQNYILQKVLDFGWDDTLHCEFDQFIGHPMGYGRRHRLIERIGKKYQWIAYYELLARLADHYELTEDPDANGFMPVFRDIDPTFKGRRVELLPTFKSQPFFWNYTNWELPNWAYVKDDLAKAMDLIFRVDDQGDEWLVLETTYHWKEPRLLGASEGSINGKQLWTHLKSYIVQRSDVNSILKKLKGKNFMNDWMPQSRERHDVFYQEGYRVSRASYYQAGGYPGYDWSTIRDERRQGNIGQACVTTTKYAWPDDRLRLHLPASIIFELMNLRPGRVDGQMINDRGEVICFDPAIFDEGMSGLFIRKEPFFKMLDEHDLTVFWTVLGAKEVILVKILQEMQFSGTVTFENNKWHSQFKYFKDPYS